MSVNSAETTVAVPDAFAQGQASYRAGAYAEAAAIFHRICISSPEEPTALRMLGLRRLRVGDPAGALELLAKARSFAPAQHQLPDRRCGTDREHFDAGGVSQHAAGT